MSLWNIYILYKHERVQRSGNNNVFAWKFHLMADDVKCECVHLSLKYTPKLPTHENFTCIPRWGVRRRLNGDGVRCTRIYQGVKASWNIIHFITCRAMPWICVWASFVCAIIFCCATADCFWQRVNVTIVIYLQFINRKSSAQKIQCIFYATPAPSPDVCGWAGLVMWWGRWEIRSKRFLMYALMPYSV